MSSLLVTCRNKSAVEQHYLPAIRLGGWDGEILVVAPGDTLPPMGEVAGLLMTGGDDIHPRWWDEAELLHTAAAPDEARDALEMPTARAAWAAGLPILGICRGEQLLNVALGGSLIQDLPSQFHAEAILHQRGTSALPELAHTVQVAVGSKLASLVHGPEVEVNSRHHQAVLRVAPGLKPVAWHRSPIMEDKGLLVEAIEAEDAGRWVVGVQWHPENLVGLEGPIGRSALGIFEGFAKALKG